MATCRRRLHLPAFATTLLAALAIGPPAAHAACPAADLPPLVASIPVTQATTVCLVNEQRVARGLLALTREAMLESAATGYAQAMVSERFFSHVAPSGMTLQQRLASYAGGAETWSVGENLAWGAGVLATPSSIVGRWMESDLHRANILDPAFREIGIGIVPGSPSGSLPALSATYTATFGMRVAGSPVRASAVSGSAAAPTRTSVAAPARAAGAGGAPDGHAPSPAKAAKTLSAATKRRIKARCTRAVRRSRTRSRASGKSRIDRCVRKRLRAAAR